MTIIDLDTTFNQAVAVASKMSQASLAQDVQLRLYAFYKQATFGTVITNNSASFDLRNAFKINAWMQISHMSVEQAKEAYIDTVNSILEEIEHSKY